MDRKIKNGIRDFILEVNPTIKVKFQNWDLEANVFEETVYVGKCYNRKTDKWYKNFIQSIYPECSKFNIFLLSLLHEIGHIETWDDDIADQKDIIYGLLKVKFDSEKENLTQTEMEEYCNEYFKIPLEWNATEWGIQFALAHPDLMEKYNWLSNY